MQSFQKCTRFSSTIYQSECHVDGECGLWPAWNMRISNLTWPTRLHSIEWLSSLVSRWDVIRCWFSHCGNICRTILWAADGGGFDLPFGAGDAWKKSGIQICARDYARKNIETIEFFFASTNRQTHTPNLWGFCRSLVLSARFHAKAPGSVTLLPHW